jgi:hypothetical protein
LDAASYCVGSKGLRIGAEIGNIRRTRMQAEQIAQALGNAKKVGNGWLASCPVSSHGQGNGDRNPSLSVTEGEDGKPLFFCHGGCDQETVFHAVKDYGLLPDLPNPTDFLTQLKPLPKQEPVLEQEWHYTDEDGVTQHVKQRYKTADSKGKSYKQYRVDENGRRHASMTGANIVPYQLPEIEFARKTGRTVFLCEGEKAADAIRSIGAYATCTHNGASNFPEDVVKYFVGLTVAVVPDNDVVGWEYARKAVKALKTVTKSIRVVDLGLEEIKEDAYEFVHKYGKVKEDLVEITKATPSIQNETDVTTPARLLGVAETQESQELELPQQPLQREGFKLEAWDDIEDEPVEWLIQGVIPQRSFVALYAPPASFKSFVALDIAECIATGRQFLGHEIAKQGAVLYIAGEGHGGIGTRIKALKTHHNTPKGAPVYFLRRQVNLRSSQTDLKDLVNAIDELKAIHEIEFKMIIIDTLARAFGGGNENASEDMGAFITAAGAIQGKYECSLLVVHHAGKDATKGLRGHSSLLGAVDTELEIIRIEGAQPPKGILHISKQKDGEDGQRIGFKMVEVTTGSSGVIDFEGTSSLAVEADEEMDTDRPNQATPPNRTGAGMNQRLALSCLHDAIKKYGEMQVVDGMRNKCIKIDQWRDEFKKRMGSDVMPDTLKKAWYRVKADLADSQKVIIYGDLCWAVYADDDDAKSSNSVVVQIKK